MNSQRILVLGGGFAGLWSAVGAVRKREELGLGPNDVEVTLVNRDAFHSIRVRNYESDLSQVRVPLDDVLAPIGVPRVEAEVAGIDVINKTVGVRMGETEETQILPYDRLVFALGSQVIRPNIPGLTPHGHDVDTFSGAIRLEAHLRGLSARPEAPGQYTVIVVGAGLTGVEVAAEMPARLQALLEESGIVRPIRVILVDHHPQIGSDMGDGARAVITEALENLGVEIRTGVSVASINETGMALDSGEVIPAATVIWCAGMRANPLTRSLPGEHDHFGRVPVDPYMKLRGASDIFAAGDAALAMMDETHGSVMSCQHSRPMGRFAGHNVVCDLLGLPMMPLRIESYVTILDLGPWGAVHTQGWDRVVIAKGEKAKRTKETINRQRIYPPLTRIKQDILDAAAPVVQLPPR